MAAAIARSPPLSLMQTPPTTLTKMPYQTRRWEIRNTIEGDFFRYQNMIPGIAEQ